MTDSLRGARRAAMHAVLGKNVFLSPHFDDVALSCGGTAALLEPGEGATITIFAAPAPPDAALNAYARRLHARWGDQDSQAANEKRRAEESCAMAQLGLDFMLMDYGDAIYRGERYTAHDHIFGAIHPDEEHFGDEIAERLKELLKANGFGRDIVVYAPLGLGHHVDHLLTHSAARRLQSDGWDVLFYEDYPYAQKDPAALEARLDELGFPAATPTLTGDRAYWGYREIDAVIAQKIAAIACYESQISSLFAGPADIAPKVRDYAATVRRQQLAEHVAELQARSMSHHEIETWLAREEHQRTKRGQSAWRYAERFWRLVEG